MKKISEEIKENIVETKRKNPFQSSLEVSQKYHVSEATIRQIWKENHCSTLELTGIRYRKYNVIDDFFEKINSHEKAYLLGVWYSDGYLVRERRSDGDIRSTKRVGLDVKDIEWLTDIKNTLGSEAPLQKTSKPLLKRLKITSPKMFEDLKNKGCVENKTFLLKFPTSEQVPFDFLNSFILGILDGDGSITIATPRKERRSPEVQMTFTGTYDVITGIQKFLKVDHLKLYQRWPERNNNNYTLQISGFHTVLSILNLLYKDAPDICLKRKKEKFEKIANDSRAQSKDCVLIPANPNDNGV